jgi:hypothetical protein
MDAEIDNAKACHDILEELDVSGSYIKTHDKTIDGMIVARAKFYEQIVAKENR